MSQNEVSLSPEQRELFDFFKEMQEASSKNMYRLLRKAVISKTIEMTSEQVGVLEEDALVEVVQTVHRADLCRVRAEIVEPAGWMSLEAPSEGVLWAKPVTDIGIGAQELAWLTRDILDIYVGARPTLEERVRILKETLLWRVENRDLLNDCVCPRCAEEPLSHDARCFGTDADGDLVIMNCFALPRSFNPEGIAQHMTCEFERSLQAYPQAKQWTWIVHMHGFGIKNCDPRTSLKLLHLLQVAYRDRLKCAIVLDAPSIFSSLWSTLQPVIKERTAKRIVFASWPAFRGELFSMLGDDVAGRLALEIEENKDPAKSKAKTWTPYWADPHVQPGSKHMDSAVCLPVADGKWVAS